MSHNYDHHDHAHTNRRRLAATLALAATYMLAEAIGGWWAGSLALLADAAHMLSDVAALALSLFALWIAYRPAPPHKTYGYYRAEILAALVNGVTLGVISIGIVMEAIERFQSPQQVMGGAMLVIACGGLVVNIAGLFLLHGGREDNLNIRGAWLHVLTDALGSVGAIVAGLAIWLWQLHWVDPAASLAIAALVLFSSWKLLSDAVSILMENAPRGVDVQRVHAALSQCHGVVEVHDLHVWTIASGLPALSAHVVAAERSYDDILHDARRKVREQFGIEHITIQVEPQDFPEHVCPMQ